MITIYAVPECKNRFQFVAEHFFNHILGVDFQITSDAVFYQKQEGPGINYSNERLERGIQIRPEGLLAETGIRPDPDFKLGERYNPAGKDPFDPFAAAFYLLSLYREYFPSKWDLHGRFDHRQSPLYENNWLETPVVDRWAYQLKAALEDAGCPRQMFNLRKYRVVDTYDVDHPFLYRYKGLVKNVGGAVRDLWRERSLGCLGDRLAVLLRWREDPLMHALRLIDAEQNGQNFYLFVLLGDRGKYGRSEAYTPRDYYRFLNLLEGAIFGLHASYKTMGFPDSSDRLRAEKRQLENLFQRTVIHSRSHFLRVRTPDSFRQLLDAGILEDFSLTFAGAPGFRSGTSVPHYFYDLQEDRKTQLLLRPTVMMDTSIIGYLKLTPDLALDRIKSLIDACYLSGGDYLSLWHNSNLINSPRRDNPWIRVFVESRRYALSLIEFPISNF